MNISLWSVNHQLDDDEVGNTSPKNFLKNINTKIEFLKTSWQEENSKKNQATNHNKNLN